MGDFILGLLVMIAVTAIFCLFVALFLRLSAKWITKTEMEYGHAYKTALMASLANLFLTLTFGFLAGAMAGDAGVGLVNLAMLPGGFLLISAIVSTRLSLSFPQSMLVTLVTGAMSGVVAIIGFFAVGFVVAMIAVA